MLDYIDYITADSKGVKVVKCMLGCNTIIAKRKKSKKTKEETLIANIIYTTYPIKLTDGSTANLLLCKKCLKKGKPNLTKFEKTMHKGWEKEQDAVYKNKSSDEYNKAMQRVTDLQTLKKMKEVQ